MVHTKTKRRRSSRSRGTRKAGSRKKPFQTELRTAALEIEGDRLNKKRKGMFLGYQKGWGQLDIDNDVSIDITYNGKPAIIRLSLERSQFPIEVQRSRFKNLTIFFAHGVLVQTHEISAKGVPIFRLISQQQHHSHSFHGAVIEKAGISHQNNLPKLTIHSMLK